MLYEVITYLRIEKCDSGLQTFLNGSARIDFKQCFVLYPNQPGGIVAAFGSFSNQHLIGGIRNNFV